MYVILPITSFRSVRSS